MRIRLLIISCSLASLCLGVTLQGAWGQVDAPDGTQYRVSLRKVSHVLQPRDTGAAREDCDYVRGKGHVQLCAPAEDGDAPFSMLCSAFTLVATALCLALAAVAVNVVSPYRAKTLGAQFTGASFIAALLGAIVARAAMPHALAVVQGMPMQLGGIAFSSAWCAIGLLLFAAGLSTTSIMLGHD